MNYFFQLFELADAAVKDLKFITEFAKHLNFSDQIISNLKTITLNASNYSQIKKIDGKSKLNELFNVAGQLDFFERPTSNAEEITKNPLFSEIVNELLEIKNEINRLINTNNPTTFKYADELYIQFLELHGNSEISSSNESQLNLIKSIPFEIHQEVYSLKNEFKGIKKITLADCRRELLAEFIAHKKEASEVKNQIENLLEKVSSEIVTKNYIDAAKREKELADLFRAGGLVLSFATIIYITFFGQMDYDILKNTNIDNSIKYISVFKPLLFSLFSISVCGFLFKEGSKHRNLQNLNEQQAFRISAMTPLLHGIEVPQQIGIRHDVIKSMFSNEKQISIQDDTNNSINVLAQVIKRLIPESPKK